MEWTQVVLYAVKAMSLVILLYYPLRHLSESLAHSLRTRQNRNLEEFKKSQAIEVLDKRKEVLEVVHRNEEITTLKVKVEALEKIIKEAKPDSNEQQLAVSEARIEVYEKLMNFIKK